MSAIISPSANGGAIVFSGHSVRVDEATAVRAEAAASAGVAVGQIYRVTGGTVAWRLV